MKFSCFCDWLCPKRKKQEGPYDVHEETFEMDDNIAYIEDSDKRNHDPSASQANHENHHKLSSQDSMNVQVQISPMRIDTHEDDQKKFVQSKNHIQEDPKPILPIEPQLVPRSQQPVPESEQPVPESEQPAPTPTPTYEKPKYNILPSKIKKKSFNPQDYYFKNQTNEFRVKNVGTLNSQQFNIENCKNGTYFIFDNSANIYIDDCQDCFVFAAPVQASLFLRNCNRIMIVGVFGQFRTYNAHSCQFSIYCKSQPVIQSSSDIHFSSLVCPEYPELRKQFAKAKFSPWNNNWSQIHNFTKKQGQTHHTLDGNPTYPLQIDWQKAFSLSNTTQSNPTQQIVPFIQGILPLDHEPTRTMLIFSQQASSNDQLLYRWVQDNKLLILRASKSKVGEAFIVAMLVDLDQHVEIDFQGLGNPTVLRDLADVRQAEASYFVTFKDQR